MSREHDVLMEKYNQLLDKLEATDPVQHPREFGDVLDMLDRMHFAFDRLRLREHNVVREIGEAIPISRVGLTPVEKPEPSIEELTRRVMDNVIYTEEPAPEEPTKTYTKEEVRAALAKSRKNGVNVTELLDELGYDNFSAVPAGKYGEIMAKLGES